MLWEVDSRRPDCPRKGWISYWWKSFAGPERSKQHQLNMIDGTCDKHHRKKLVENISFFHPAESWWKTSGNSAERKGETRRERESESHAGSSESQWWRWWSTRLMELLAVPHGPASRPVCSVDLQVDALVWSACSATCPTCPVVLDSRSLGLVGTKVMTFSDTVCAHMEYVHSTLSIDCWLIGLLVDCYTFN